MYEYIKGKLTNLEPTKAVVDANGIGYAILIPLSTYSKLADQINKNVLLYIDFIVREDAQLLFGFTTTADRQLFCQVRDVSGIGPKTALSLIGHMNPEALEWAIASQDANALSKIPGIGKKTAQRLILELAEKLITTKKSSTPSTKATSMTHDAISALVNLGYSLDKSQKAVSKTLEKTKPSDLSELITAALQSF